MTEMSGAVRLSIDPESLRQFREQMQRRLDGMQMVIDPNPIIQELTEWHDEDGRHIQQLLTIRRANILTIVHFETGRVDFHPNLDGITPADIRTVRRMLKLQQTWLKRQLAQLRPGVGAGRGNIPPAE